MIVDNRTSLQVLWIPGRLRYPAHSLTVVVKGTFDLQEGRPATLAEEPMPIMGDLGYPDEEDGSPYYDSDLAHFKPRADRLLVGCCYPPDGTPTTECPVTFAVGNWTRTLKVIGHREWKPGILRMKPSKPEEFTKMELRYENSFGAESHALNPVGKGLRKLRNKDNKSLPNIEDPANPITSDYSKPAPAGFGPIARDWMPRKKLIGTYGKKWFKTRGPWFPEDMDWGVFNAAPARCQADGYLRGDESIALTNMHPKLSEFRSVLPGLRVRAFVQRVGEPARSDLEEIAMNLDTLWVDAEESRLVLVWRGVCDVASEEFEDLERLCLVTEEMEAAVRSPEEYRAEQRIDSVDSKEPEESAAVPPKVAESEGQPEEELPEEPEEEEDEVQRTEVTVARLEEMLTTLPDGPNVSEDVLAARAKILASLERLAPSEPDSSAEPQPWTRETVIEAAERGASLAKEDLAELDLSKVDFHGIVLKGARLDGCDLRDANLSNTDLSGASLERVKAAGAKLEKANLMRSDLSGAQLKEADLGDSKLTGANLEHADLTEAVLVGAELSRTNLRGANLEQVKAEGALLGGACLDGAVAREADFTGAQFGRSSLVRVALQEAKLVGAVLEDVRGPEADFTSADLTGVNAERASFAQAVFHRVRGDRSRWAQAELDGADFGEADLEEADLSRVSMKGCCLDAASLRKSNLRRSNFEEASLVGANLFHAYLAAARFPGANLSGSNLFGADLADTDFQRANLAGANLKRTRLE